jgi:hypothetical protein
MTPLQRQLTTSHEFTTDVASRVVRIGPWETYKPEPEPGRVSPYVSSMLTVASISPCRERTRLKKPGNLHRVCSFEEKFDEKLDYHDSPPDLFDNGVGKSYEGFRIAYIEKTGYVRIENDGTENIASPSEIYKFKRDLVEAARVDEKIRSYASEKGII